MKWKCEIIRILLVLMPMLCGSGCVTSALWQNENLEALKEPADDPHLRLFGSRAQSDVLVVYDEHSERSDKIHTRAYWADKNQHALEQGSAPHFVRTKTASQLEAVPVFFSSMNRIEPPPELYAILETNSGTFTLYSRSAEIGTYNLPVYNDGKGKVEKIALTPVTTTVDLTIIGGFLGYLYVAWRCGANGPIYPVY